MLHWKPRPPRAKDPSIQVDQREPREAKERNSMAGSAGELGRVQFMEDVSTTEGMDLIFGKEVNGSFLNRRAF